MAEVEAFVDQYINGLNNDINEACAGLKKGVDVYMAKYRGWPEALTRSHEVTVDGEALYFEETSRKKFLSHVGRLSRTRQFARDLANHGNLSTQSPVVDIADAIGTLDLAPRKIELMKKDLKGANDLFEQARRGRSGREEQPVPTEERDESPHSRMYAICLDFISGVGELSSHSGDMSRDLQKVVDDDGVNWSFDDDNDVAMLMSLYDQFDNFGAINSLRRTSRKLLPYVESEDFRGIPEDLLAEFKSARSLLKKLQDSQNERGAAERQAIQLLRNSWSGPNGLVSRHLALIMSPAIRDLVSEMLAEGNRQGGNDKAIQLVAESSRAGFLQALLDKGRSLHGNLLQNFDLNLGLQCSETLLQDRYRDLSHLDDLADKVIDELVEYVRRLKVSDIPDIPDDEVSRRDSEVFDEEGSLLFDPNEELEPYIDSDDDGWGDED